jgi:hypothetical protein
VLETFFEAIHAGGHRAEAASCQVMHRAGKIEQYHVPTAITAGDLAFLKALYYKNTGLGGALTRFQIQDHIQRQFALH